MGCQKSDEESKFFKQHMIRGFCVGVFFCAFFMFFPKIIGLEKVSLTLYDLYSLLSTFEIITICSIIILTMLMCVKCCIKFVRSFKFSYGLHGIVLGSLIGVIYVLFEYFLGFVLLFFYIMYIFSIVVFLCFAISFHKNKKINTNRYNDFLRYEHLSEKITHFLFPELKNNDEKKQIYENGKIFILYGENGIGKSHVLKLVEQSLLSKDKDVHYFYPSRYSIDVMKVEFFKKLVAMLTKKYFLPSLSFFSDNFANLIETSEKPFRIAGFFKNFLSPLLFGKNQGIADILKYYKEESKDKVLFIDELDRCSTEQIEAFISTLRNLGSDFSFSIGITFTHDLEEEMKKNMNCNSRESIFEKFAIFYYDLPRLSGELVVDYYKEFVKNKDVVKVLNIEKMGGYAKYLIATPRLIKLFYCHSLGLKEYLDNEVSVKNGTTIFFQRSVLCLLALKTGRPKIFSALKDTYIQSNYGDFSAEYFCSQYLPELFKNNNNNFTQTLESYFKEIEKLVRFLQNSQESFWVKYYFMNLKLFHNLYKIQFNDSNFIYKFCNEIKDIISYQIDKDNSEEFKNNMSLQIADIIKINFTNYDLKRKSIELLYTFKQEALEEDTKKLWLFVYVLNRLDVSIVDEVFTQLHSLYEKDGKEFFYILRGVDDENAFYNVYIISLISTFIEKLNKKKFSNNI